MRSKRRTPAMQSGNIGIMLAVVTMAAAILGASAAAARLHSRPFHGWEGSSSSSSSRSPMAKGLFILGDSSVDCGDNTLFYPLLHRNMSLLPCNNESSHSLLPHFLAEKMRLPRTPTFYGQNVKVRGLMNGLNFGSAMATILLNNPTGPSFQSLHQQLRQVIDTIELLQLELGPNAANEYIRSSVFLLSFGKNDFINFFNSDHSPSHIRTEGNGLARILVDQVAESIRDLYDANVRKIACMGILPLGCAPRTVFDWQSRTGCVTAINGLVFEYNKLLREKISDLRIELPQLHITFCDVFRGVAEILAQPNKYGFDDARGACCGLGRLGAGIGCLSVSMACSQSSSHVWWDLYNPTETVNSLLADSAWSGRPFSDFCHPLSVEDLVYSP